MSAVSTNLVETSKFGVQEDRVFGFWDWVGGRYSVCSAIGILPLSLHFGFAYMVEFLRGANQIDHQFKTEKSVKNNLPLLLGILTWYRTSIQVIIYIYIGYRNIKPWLYYLIVNHFYVSLLIFNNSQWNPTAKQLSFSQILKYLNQEMQQYSVNQAQTLNIRSTNSFTKVGM